MLLTVQVQRGATNRGMQGSLSLEGLSPLGVSVEAGKGQWAESSLVFPEGRQLASILIL